MSKLGTFLRIARVIAPVALAFTPLAPISGAVTIAIGEAEQIEGASSADKRAHVTQIAIQAAEGANAKAGRVVVDPEAVEAIATHTISAVITAINAVKGVHLP